MRSKHIKEIFNEEYPTAYDLFLDDDERAKYYPGMDETVPIETSSLARYIFEHHPEDIESLDERYKTNVIELWSLLLEDFELENELYLKHAKEYDFYSLGEFMVREGMYYPLSDCVW